MTLSEAFLTLRDECVACGCVKHPQAVHVVHDNILQHARGHAWRLRSGLDPDDIAQAVWTNQLLKPDADGLPCTGIRLLCERNESDAGFSMGVSFLALTEHKAIVRKTREVPLEFPPDDASQFEPEDQTASFEAALEAYRMLRPVEQRLIEKRFLLDMTLATIACSEGKSVGWVHDRIGKARTRLRALYELEWN